MDAFKIGITIAVVNQASAALGVIGTHFATTNAKAKQLHDTLSKIKVLTAGGLIAGGVGMAGIRAMESLVKPAMAYAHQLSLMNAKGMEHVEIAKSIKAAWETTRTVQTTTATKNLETIMDLRGVFGSTEEAIKRLENMQRIQSVLANVQGGIGAKDVGYAAAKIMELRGVTDPKEFDVQADLLTKAVMIMGGGNKGASVNEILNAVKYEKTARYGFSNDFTYGILPTIIQENKGAPTGTALMSMYRAIVGGRLDKKALPLWASLGLADASNAKVTGETAMLHPGFAKGSQQFAANPFEYISKTLLPAMVAHGITHPAAQLAMTDRLFSNRNASGMVSLFMTQGARLMKDATLISKAGGVGALAGINKDDPEQKMKIFEAQMENLRTILGTKVLPIVNPALDALASGLMRLSAWADKHPVRTEWIVIAVGALSAAAVALGGVALVAAGIAALAAGGVYTIAAAGVVALNDAMWGMYYGLGRLESAIGSFFTRIGEWFSSSWLGRQVGLDSAVPPPAASAPQQPGNVYMDARKVGLVVSGWLSDQLSLPASQGRGVDPRAAFPQPAFVGGP